MCRIENRPSLSSVPSFGPEESTPALCAREFSKISAGGLIGGFSGKDLPTEKIWSWCWSTNTWSMIKISRQNNVSGTTRGYIRQMHLTCLCIWWINYNVLFLLLYSRFRDQWQKYWDIELHGCSSTIVYPTTS